MPDFFPQRPAARPMIYAYEDTNPQYQGLLKVGYTAVDVDRRVAQQYPTKRPDGSTPYRIVCREPAMRPDGSCFTDHEVHRALQRRGIPRMGGEWYRCTPEEVCAAVLAVRLHTDNAENRTETFALRPEQAAAVERTAAYYRAAYQESAQRTPQIPLEREDAVRQDLCRLPAGPADGLCTGAGAHLQARRAERLAGGPAAPHRL